jgi:hypothetical protein
MNPLRITAALTAALVSIPALVACGDSEAAQSPDAPASLTLGESPSASRAASPAPVVKPSLPSATDDLAGRKAFAQYVARSWEYASVTNDPSALLKADPEDSCDGCRDAARAFRERAAQGWRIDDLGMDISATDVAAREGRITIVGMAVSFDRNRAVNDDGSVRQQNPAQPHLYFEVGMTFERDHFQITDYQLSE